MRPRSRSARLLAVASLVGVAALTAALAPASAASGPPAVKGGAVQAWQATAYRPAAPATVPSVDYYFTGTPTDQVDKLNGENTASFSKAKPTGSSEGSQNAEGGLDDGTPRDPSTAYWSAPYSGSISGKLSMTWWWTTLDPVTSALNAPNLGVRVWADPGTPQQKLIGSNDVVMDAAGLAPVEQKATVDVKGVVAKSLLIQAIALFEDVGRGYRVYYGSAAHPSRFSIPTGTVAPVKLPSNPAVKDTDPLVLSATPIGRKAAEPTIGITKKGNAFFAAADFDGLSPANPRTLIYASYDRNGSWTDITPTLAGESFPPATLDPYIYVDQETSRIFSDDLLVGCSLLQWSDDEGKTWSQGNPFACDSPVDDHQTIVAGNPPPGVTTNGYPNVIYYCVNKVAGAVCARSLDGGQTFLATGAPAFTGVQPAAPDGTDQAGSPGFCGGLHGHIITDPAGRLYLPKGHCTNPWLAVSEDGGQTWRQTLVNKMTVAGTQTAVASDSAGNIYYLWWAADTKLPYMAVSRDAGKTFGPALLVGPPGLKAVNFPSIDAGKPGQVAISYPGTTDAEVAKPSRPWNYYVAVTTNALAATPVFHSATANRLADPVHRGVCVGRCAGMYDFLDVVIDPAGTTWATAVDTCTKACTSAEGPNLTSAQQPEDAQGIAVRQLSGAGRVVSAPAAPPAAAPPGTSSGTLPTTGGGAGLLAWAAVVLLATGAGSRWLRHKLA